MRHLQHTSVMPSIVYERERENHCRLQVVQAIEWRVKESYGFLPVSNLPTYMNVRQVLGDMSPGCYFLRASNSTFYDLTWDWALPLMATSLFGPHACHLTNGLIVLVPVTLKQGKTNNHCKVNG